VTLSALLSSARQALKRSGVVHPDVEAELVLSHVLGLRRAEVYLEPGRPIGPDEEALVREILTARARRYPLQYLLGEVEFMGLPLATRDGVFIPRPETEILVETMIERGKRLGSAPAVLDLATGSGAIAISLARYLEPGAVVATDISPAAIRLARENARLNLVESRISFVVAEGLAALRPQAGGLFDLVVSNPPYIPTDEIAGLQPEVRDFEPRLALDGGPDGLRFLGVVAGEIPSILKQGGIVAFEIGATQAAAASAILAQAGLVGIEVVKDLAGRDRVIIGNCEPRGG
jgi:release factor glutamine methyltransferase